MKTIVNLIVAGLMAGCASQKRQSSERAAPPEGVAPVSLYQSMTVANITTNRFIFDPVFLFQSITVTNILTNRVFYVVGEVREPGRFIWRKGLTLTNAIAMAGGFTDFANRSRLIIQRSGGSQELYNYSRILAGLTNSPLLKESDLVTVHRRIF